MRTVLELTIPGDPVPKGRPRHTKRGHTYTPERTRVAEADLQQRLVTLGIDPVDEPVRLTLRFRCRTARRTDLDNLVKLVSDALNGIVFTDDHWVYELSASLERGCKDDAATCIRVETLN